MTDVPDENHDGSTQPLPINGANEADTVPFDHVPIAEPTTLPAAVPPPVSTMPTAPRRTWAPWLLVSLVALAAVVAAAVLLPPLLAPSAVTNPSPTPVASVSTSITPVPVDDGEPAPDPDDPAAPPPPPAPTTEPTVDPPDPTPVPTP